MGTSRWRPSLAGGFSTGGRGSANSIGQAGLAQPGEHPAEAQVMGATTGEDDNGPGGFMILITPRQLLSAGGG